MNKQAVIAAGSPGTARVGAEILAEGGNAVDAACAACLATSAHEPVLTSLAGGGVMLVHDASSGRDHIVDFFSDAPGLGLTQQSERDFLPVVVDFGSATQEFHIGRASAAVPGTLQGLSEAHRRFGRLPMKELIAPVCRDLRQGMVLDAFQASTFKLLETILLHEAATRALHCQHGHSLSEGARFTNPQLADTLEAMVAHGTEPFVREVMHPLLLDQFGPAAGGCITAQDLERYQVRVIDPLQFCYRGCSLSTHAWPAHGGSQMGLMLKLLEDIELSSVSRLGAEHLAALLAAQRVANEAKHEEQPLLTPGLAPRWHRRFRDLMAGAEASPSPAASGPGHTTHISVIDAEGNAATVTISYGEGCGSMLGDTGLHLNNFMGEDDLHPGGFFTVAPGTRLQTNMCPTRLDDGQRQIVLGSGGANRIRTAIAQVLINLVDYALPLDQAVAATRLHVEDGALNVEGHELEDLSVLRALAGDDKIVAFAGAAMFFGGVHVAARDVDGQASGAGDARRNGQVQIVEID